MQTLIDVPETSKAAPPELSWHVKRMIMRRRRRNGHGRNRRGRIIGRRRHSPLYNHHPPKEQRVGKAMLRDLVDFACVS